MRIESIDHLKQLCKNREQLDTYILLNGCCKTSKTFLIDSDGEGFVLINEIDGTEERIHTFKGLLRNSFYKEALDKRAWFVYDYEVKK